MDAEKIIDSTTQPIADVGDTTYGETGADIKLFADSQTRSLKTTADGTIILVPQPSEDPADPLNWGKWRKTKIFIALSIPAFLSDFGVTYGASVFPEQAMTWNMSVPAAANSINPSIFMNGVGAVLCVPLCQRYGRLPVLFWSELLACVCVIAATPSPTYGGFAAARALQGVFGSPPQVVGLAIIHDLYFFHERTRMISIWVWTFLVGPVFAPFMSSLIVSRLTWRQDFAVLAGLFAFSTLAVCLLGEETMFDRTATSPKSAPTGVAGRLATLIGITGARTKGRPSMLSVCKHMLNIQLKPHIFLVTTGFLMVTSMWGIGIVATAAQFFYPPPYNFTPVQVGLFYLAPTIGVILGELWSHFFLDWTAKWYIRKHNGVFNIEQRLWGCYPALITSIVGLVMFGQTFQHELHWSVAAVGWLIYDIGQLAVSVTVSAYCLDSMPKHSTIVASLISFWRTAGGFCVGYFQLKWVKRSGAGASFGAQAGILAAIFATVVVVQVYGKKWRARFPPPQAEI